MKENEDKIQKAIDALFENAQKPLGDFLGGASAAILDDWTLADLSLCKEPAIRKKIKGRIVMYNKADRIIYIEDMASCVVNDACGIINDIKWNS